MILSDRDIRAALADGEVAIESDADVQTLVGPASMDFRLGNSFKKYRKDLGEIDPQRGVAAGDLDAETVADGGFYLLKQGEFVLGVTKEKITLGKSLVARCEGRSSLGRLGLVIHSTAGFIDPGFSGTITLEITNVNHVPILLRPGQRIGQFAFERLETPCEVSYAERKGSKYMHQMEAQESRVGDDREFRK